MATQQSSPRDSISIPFYRWTVTLPEKNDDNPKESLVPLSLDVKTIETTNQEKLGILQENHTGEVKG